MKVNIKTLIDDVQCYETVRELRWPEGRECPFCDSKRVIKRGYDDKEPARQRYECKECGKRFDDLSGNHLCRASSTPQGVDFVSLFHGVEPVQQPDRQGIGSGPY